MDRAMVLGELAQLLRSDGCVAVVNHGGMSCGARSRISEEEVCQPSDRSAFIESL